MHVRRSSNVWMDAVCDPLSPLIGPLTLCSSVCLYVWVVGAVPACKSLVVAIFSVLVLAKSRLFFHASKLVLFFSSNQACSFPCIRQACSFRRCVRAREGFCATSCVRLENKKLGHFLNETENSVCLLQAGWSLILASLDSISSCLRGGGLPGG